MTGDQGERLLDATLDAWERSNTALLNLLSLIQVGGLEARAMAGSPTVGEMLAHVHRERMVSVLENAPEWAGAAAQDEWATLGDERQIAAHLGESARRVRDAVRARTLSDQALDRDFAHPIQLLQFLIFHDSYHHGQIKLALKAAGCPIRDDDAGPLIWDVWRAR